VERTTSSSINPPPKARKNTAPTSVGIAQAATCSHSVCPSEAFASPAKNRSTPHRSPPPKQPKSSQRENIFPSKTTPSSTKNAQQINCLPDSKAGRLSFANVPLQRSVNARTKTFPPQSCRCLKAQAHQPDMAPSKPSAHSASVPMPAPINSAQHSAIQTLGCNASPPTQLPTSDPTNAKPVSVTCSP